MSRLKEAVQPGATAPARPGIGLNARMRKFGLLFGGLLLVMVAMLAVQAVRSAAKDKEAILTGALDQGFWIARSLEIGHSQLLDDQRPAMRAMIEEILRHQTVESLLVVNENGQVLIASDEALGGTRLADSIGEPPEHGKIVRSDERIAQMAFPAYFSEASRHMGNLHPQRDKSLDDAKWVVVTLNISAAHAHYRSSVLLWILVLCVAVALSIAAFFGIRLFERALKLEQIKLGLERFVPRTVRKLIEDNPDEPMLSKVEQSATVLFLDIERYTRLSEEMSAEAVNRLVEKYFSAFLDIILSGDGEINETAGDGVMAIFAGADSRSHALRAVRAAVAIREQTLALNRARAPHEPEILVNVGVNTGQVLIGATTIKGATGEHLTYTASGRVTNIAARLCDLGQMGEISLGSETAGLVAADVALSGPLQTELKNVREPVQVYRVA